jgi:hypothetical protein
MDSEDVMEHVVDWKGALELPGNNKDKMVIGRKAHRKPSRKLDYFPRLPCSVVEIVCERQAEIALPLILSLARRFAIANREAEVPLSAVVWERAGDPSERKRRTILTHLRQMPEIFGLIDRRTSRTRYRVVRGPIWETPEAFATAKETDDDDG